MSSSAPTGPSAADFCIHGSPLSGSCDKCQEMFVPESFRSRLATAEAEVERLRASRDLLRRGLLRRVYFTLSNYHDESVTTLNPYWRESYPESKRHHDRARDLDARRTALLRGGSDHAE